MNNTKQKNKIFLLIMFSIIFLISITIAIFANQIFKLNGRKFLNLLIKEQYIMSKLDEYKNEFFSNGDNSLDITIKNNYLRQLQDFLGLNKIKVSYGDIKINANVKKDEENLDTTISLNNKESEIIKDNKSIALKVSDVTNEYIIFENQNIENDIKKLLNLSGEKTSIKETDEFLRKYTDILVNEINNYIEIKENVKIKISDEEYETEQYILNLDSTEFSKVCGNILKKLKDDEESLKLITNKYNELASFQNSFININTEEITIEELKQNINEFINKISEKQNRNEALKIILYKYEDENIKTEIEILDNRYNLVIETIEKDKKDYMNFNINRNNKEFTIKYIGEKNNNTYEGKFNIASILNLELARVSMKRINSKTEVRKVEELNPSIKIKEITSEKIAEIQNRIRKIFNGKEQIEYLETTGIFKIKKPQNNNEIIENSKLAYKRINPIMTTDEVVKIMGNPSKIESGDDGNYLYWNQGENIELISVRAKGIKLYDVYNNVAQSEKYKKDIVEELGKEVEDINFLKQSITAEMTKEEVINILGDKYIEVSKSNLGYTKCMWFDKNQNSIEVEFDEKEKVIM